jgi:hypothetical protein
MEDLLLEQFADDLLHVINNSGWSTLDQIEGNQDTVTEQILNQWYRTDDGVILLNEAINDFNLFKDRYPTNGWGRAGGLVWRNDVVPYHQNPDYNVHVNGTNADLLPFEENGAELEGKKRRKQRKHKNHSKKRKNSNKRKHSKKRKSSKH